MSFQFEARIQAVRKTAARFGLQKQAQGFLAPMLGRGLAFAARNPRATAAIGGGAAGALAGGPDHRMAGAMGGAGLAASFGGRGQPLGKAISGFGQRNLSQFNALSRLGRPMAGTSAPAAMAMRAATPPPISPQRAALSRISSVMGPA
jgi:hypothetical protein